jgi:hypothetical protein
MQIRSSQIIWHLQLLIINIMVAWFLWFEDVGEKKVSSNRQIGAC